MNVMKLPTGNWRTAGTALGLSLLFPGCGHAYAGLPVRGAVWAGIYLGLVLPGAILAYIVWASWDAAVLTSIVGFLAAFLLLCGFGPLRVMLRGLEQPRKRPAVWVLEMYAALVALGAALEVRWFLENCVDEARVQTSSLEPILAKGEAAVVLLSRYVRPVHGDVVLVRAGETRLLGRVLAKSDDSVEARDGRLFVNGIELALHRTDQRRELEQAGRAGRTVRRRRMVDLLPWIGRSASPIAIAGPGGFVSWTERGWGPSTVPCGSTLILPDGILPDGILPGADAIAATSDGAARAAPSSLRGRLVQNEDIVGRVIR